ncbi:hypothetical protein LPB140_11450 [Sphingorhabdus lutea]|uniref:Uncharacterized protein n=1 Tax=Sphingorhabdus lutea TaxID=1913578 RepID=A0A1L3JDS0_9SPHN|nr:hypothetical protein LPB140_11450 [Sphingorhabdus lutea]
MHIPSPVQQVHIGVTYNLIDSSAPDMQAIIALKQKKSPTKYKCGHPYYHRRCFYLATRINAHDIL